MTTPARYERIAFVASPSAEAQQALASLVQTYGNHTPAKADVVVALGGDGLMRRHRDAAPLSYKINHDA